VTCAHAPRQVARAKPASRPKGQTGRRGSVFNTEETTWDAALKSSNPELEEHRGVVRTSSRDDEVYCRARLLDCSYAGRQFYFF
jgi:hypothetical protein